MNESLCTRCPIGIPRERKASTMCPPPTSRPAIAAQSFRARCPLSCTRSKPQPRRHALSIPVARRRAHPLPLALFTVHQLVIIVAEHVISIIIYRLGTACFLDSVLCRSLFEAFIMEITSTQNKRSHPPPYPNPEEAERAKVMESATKSSVNVNANANPNALIQPQPHHQDEDIENENAKFQSVKGIVSSPDNPATIRRLSQDDSSNTVSWHKRVVVHRVPRSDASRSMFVSSNQSKEGLSSQCCVIV